MEKRARCTLGVDGPIDRDLMALAGAHRVQPDRETANRHLVLRYEEAGASHEVWIPDAETVDALMAVGHDLGVAGYAIWRMGGEDPRCGRWWRGLSHVARALMVCLGRAGRI